MPSTRLEPRANPTLHLITLPNYYISNDKVLVPNYNDPNDASANSIIQTLYPSRTAVGIDVINLYENGGMVHCVT